MADLLKHYGSFHHQLLLEHFPGFGELYRELAAFMMTLEELIAMISEELSNMNRNAEQPMATEPQEKNAALEENKALAHEKNVWDAFNMPLEEALAIFSDGLRIMDRNTERLMVKELQAEKAVLEELIKIEKRKKVLQQKLDIFKLHKHEMSARQIADTLQISLEIVQEVLNV